MKITSSAFKDGEYIPKEYTCEGPNISPPLNFEEIPSNTQSLVLLIEDPDAPSKHPWVHWLVFNIPPNTIGFQKHKIADGAVEGLCNGNTFGYEGPCPNKNEHRYHFKLFALDIILSLPPESDKRALSQQMKGHIIEKAELTGLYQKEKLKQKIFK